MMTAAPSLFAQLNQRKRAHLRGKLSENVSMHTYCTWGVGGIAALLFEPEDADDLGLFLQTLPEGTKICMLGRGSNLLVRDGGYLGAMILTRKLKDFKYLPSLDEQKVEVGQEAQVQVQAGMQCAKFAQHLVAQSLSGGEFFCGIPGTIGGALAMNAGCFNSQTWEHVDSVCLMNTKGEQEWFGANCFTPRYRSIKINNLAFMHKHAKRNEPMIDQQYVHGDVYPHLIFVAAKLKFVQEEQQAGQMIKNKISQLLAQRKQSQPVDSKNAGSVFRNPPSDHAAYLIERCGLKGSAIGDAQISNKHANFIENRGQASASEVEMLIEHIRTKVKERFAVALDSEVQIVGEKLPPANVCPVVSNREDRQDRQEGKDE